nr:hypothetical protein Iba_chr11fCG10720 [Ipomoea batatas]
MMFFFCDHQKQGQQWSIRSGGVISKPFSSTLMAINSRILIHPRSQTVAPSPSPPLSILVLFKFGSGQMRFVEEFLEFWDEATNSEHLSFTDLSGRNVGINAVPTTVQPRKSKSRPRLATAVGVKNLMEAETSFGSERVREEDVSG